MHYQPFLMDQTTIPNRLITHYHRIGMTEAEFIMIVQLIQFQASGNAFPTPQELTERVQYDEEYCSQLLRQLLQKGWLTILESKVDQNVVNEYYSLESLWQLLYNSPEKPKSNDQEPLMNLFPLFEKEFGRALSPFEIETINMWLDEDQVKPELIKTALKEAVLMNKLNFKYIDRILREWHKKGVRSPEEARNHAKAFHSQSKQTTNNSTPRDKSVYYNWLDEE
ncbi:DNA replication protein DnaD [Pelagirhabdus alkalitolerans]|uniref:DNA replication protein DnaD n=1 Tax=Pelagirhabdus alkalitolerans TaxID=1612202 RepID=A0A1G6HA73_9BACI|nr:DNA replication protein DnaD [Pelagirhabdus alkalitolerans]